MKEYILAIDQGTTSTRVILFDERQEIAYSAQKELMMIYPEPSYVEADANEIYLSLLYCIGQLFQNTDIKPEEIKAIGITNQRETTVMWNKKTGIPIHNAIIWQSRQTSKITERYKEMGVEPLVKEKTGLLLDPYFSATKIRWLYERYPQLLDDEDIIFGTIDTWLLWKLTGGEVHATDVTNASRTLLFNIHTLTWDQELCDLFKIPMRILPEILDNNAEFGRVKVDLFGLDCPILAMIGDQQAALFGESCLKKGDIKNTYGTGGFILVNTADELIISESGLLSTIAWRLDSKVTYALEGSIFVSGSLIQWLRDGLGIIKSAQDSKELALKVKDSGGIVIIPAFVGLGAPYWDDHCRGSILGITRGTKDAHIARAALEAMAFSVKGLIDVIEKETGLSAADLKVDGGASANDLLLEIQSSVLNKDVVKKKVKEATALGAARIAGLKAGLYKIEDLKDDEESIIHPSDSTMMIETYKRWKRALEVTRMFA